MRPARAAARVRGGDLVGLLWLSNARRIHAINVGILGGWRFLLHHNAVALRPAAPRRAARETIAATSSTATSTTMLPVSATANLGGGDLADLMGLCGVRQLR